MTRETKHPHTHARTQKCTHKRATETNELAEPQWRGIAEHTPTHKYTHTRTQTRDRKNWDSKAGRIWGRVSGLVLFCVSLSFFVLLVLPFFLLFGRLLFVVCCLLFSLGVDFFSFSWILVVMHHIRLKNHVLLFTQLVHVQTLLGSIFTPSPLDIGC